jgi:outer membrane protein OmpA-like peptidoglycan-associated protein
VRRPTLRRRLAAGAALLVLLGVPLADPAPAADPPAYADPWDATTTAAAEAAAARLGAKRALTIFGSVLGIPGLTVGLQGAGTGIVASVQQLAQAKQDLGAQETALEVRVELPADVLFDFDKADIRADAADALANLATIIAAYPQGRVELSGHTDAQGSDAYNRTLSQRRADAVKTWLVSRHGVDGAKVTTRGEGEARPVADNASEEGRQRNRRVEALIHKGQS